VPPLDAAGRQAYTRGMALIVAAGHDITAGDITGATSAMQAATPDITQVAPAINGACGG
jgi:hypothetical protein